MEETKNMKIKAIKLKAKTRKKHELYITQRSTSSQARKFFEDVLAKEQRDVTIKMFFCFGKEKMLRWRDIQLEIDTDDGDISSVEFNVENLRMLALQVLDKKIVVKSSDIIKEG